MEVDEWLFRMTEYLNSVRVPDEQKAVHAAMYLRDAAAVWWRIRKENDPGPQADDSIQRWPVFREAITTQFRTIAPEQKARDDLY